MRYFKHHRLYQLDLDDANTANEQLFHNQRINRKGGPITEEGMTGYQARCKDKRDHRRRGTALSGVITDTRTSSMDRKAQESTFRPRI